MWAILLFIGLVSCMAGFAYAEYAEPRLRMICVIVGIVGIVVMFIGAIGQSLENRKNKKTEEEKRRQREEDKKSAEETLQKEIKQLTNKYGLLSNVIRLEKPDEFADIKKCLLAFGAIQLLYIDGRELLFKDIISYNITDDYSIQHGKVEYTSNTRTSTGSLIGRGLTGAVLTGGVGAVIGASSASKNTTTIGKQADDTILHKYALSINVRSLESPLIRIDLGSSTEKAEEVNAIFAYIMASKEA